MGQKLVQTFEAACKAPQLYGFFDDFCDGFGEVEHWTATKASTGTAAISAAAEGGQLAIATAATDNDHVSLQRVSSPFWRGSAAGAMICGGRFKLLEAAAGVANFAVGFAGAQPSATEWTKDNAAQWDAATLGFVAFLGKRDGETKWSLVTGNSLATLQVTTLDLAVGSNWLSFAIEVKPNAFNYEISVAVDPTGKANLIQAEQATGIIGRLPRVKHNVAFPSSAAAYFGLESKAGSAAAQSLLVDYLYAYQARP